MQGMMWSLTMATTVTLLRTHDPSRNARYVRVAASRVFINPRCPLSASSDPLAAATNREEPSTSSPLVVVDGTDMPPEPPDRTDGESDVAADG